MTQSQTTAGVDHDYSRITISSRLLPSLLCNDVQSGILDLSYSVNTFIAYCKSSTDYTLHGNFYKLNTVNSSLIFLQFNLLHVYTSPNHGSSVFSRVVERERGGTPFPQIFSWRNAVPQPTIRTWGTLIQYRSPK